MKTLSNFLATRLRMQQFLGNRWVALVHLTLRDFFRSNGPTVAAGVAYFALFSIFPLALTAIAVSSFFFSDTSKQLDVVNTIQKLVPVSTDFLSETIEEVVNNRGSISVIAAVGLLWSGLSVFSSLRKGINHAWGIGKPPNLIKERFIDLSMALGITLAIFVILVLSATLFEATEVGEWLSVIGGGVLIKLLASLLSLLVSFLVLLLMYKYVPNRVVAWRDVWLGALVGAIFFEGSKLVLAWYISRFGTFNLIYGSLGALMVILVWVYLSVFIVLLAAQFSAVYCRTMGSDAERR